MKYLLHFVLAAFVLSCSSPSTTPSKVSVIDSNDESILTNIQMVDWQKAYEDQDTVLMSKIFHSSFQLVDDNGDTYSKADEMEYAANYGPTYNEFTFEILNLSLLNNGTATVFGKGTMKGVDGAEAYITTYKVTNVFVKEGGIWQAISSHVSGVKEDRFPMVPSE